MFEPRPCWRAGLPKDWEAKDWEAKAWEGEAWEGEAWEGEAPAEPRVVHGSAGASPSPCGVPCKNEADWMHARRQGITCSRLPIVAQPRSSVFFVQRHLGPANQ
jgi:hypothetical protein